MIEEPVRLSFIREFGEDSRASGPNGVSIVEIGITPAREWFAPGDVPSEFAQCRSYPILLLGIYPDLLQSYDIGFPPGHFVTVFPKRTHIGTDDGTLVTGVSQQFRVNCLEARTEVVKQVVFRTLCRRG